MRPLMYGYLRVDLVDGYQSDVDECESRIRDFAEREGFDLGCVFREPAGARVAFQALLMELRRAECRHVVVPSMDHVWQSGRARHELVARLWSEAGAGVWVTESAANRLSVRRR